MKKSKGITLVALIITIIILLILSGVTISMILGENGIINKAKNAKNNTNRSKFEENVEIAETTYKMNLKVENEQIAYAELKKTIENYGYSYEVEDKTLKITNNEFTKTINLEQVENENESLEWMKVNNLIVTSKNIGNYSSKYSGIEEGTVFLNYDINKKDIYNPRDLSLASAQYGSALISTYSKTNDDEYLEKAKLIGNNILENKVFEKEYAHANNTNGNMLTCISSENKMNNGKWTYNSDYYTYPLDSLMSCKFLIELTRITGDTQYAETAIKVINSWIYVQKEVGTGALPNYMYYTNELSWGEGMWPTWVEYPLDISYSIYLAGMSAYQYTGDIKFKEFVDDYFSFVNNSFENYNGTFSFMKNGTEYKLPYEYICKENSTYKGKNQSNQNYTNSETNDITTDQLFYTLLGLTLYNKDSKYVSEFIQATDTLQFEDGKFWGEYTINGEKGSFEETDIEILDTAFYIRMLKICNKTEDIPKIVEMLIKNRQHSDDLNVKGAWTWNAGEKSFVIETLATSVIIQELYTDGMQ